MRKMASLRKIEKLIPISGADAIEVARVGGWNVVVKKGEYSQDDLCIYLEIDSWVPHVIAPFLSAGKVPKEYEGIPGARLRTVKLRGALSQGLVLPVSMLPVDTQFSEGDDVSDILGVIKWEPPVNVSLRGVQRSTGVPGGGFPYGIPKTDLERIQNIGLPVGELFEVTVKLDGSSCTLLHDVDGQVRVFSRNIELDRSSPLNASNAFVRISNEFEERVKSMPVGYALRGELMGPGIQGNREGFSDIKFFAFDVWDSLSENPGYLKPLDAQGVFAVHNIPTVPFLHAQFKIEPHHDREFFLQWAEKVHSINHVVAEGLVFKHVDGRDSACAITRFKAISNLFLLKEK